MARYAVTLRGFAEQEVYVEANSAREAREKARIADFDDVAGPVDWERDFDRYPESHGWARWPARVAAEMLVTSE